MVEKLFKKELFWLLLAAALLALLAVEGQLQAMVSGLYVLAF